MRGPHSLSVTREVKTNAYQGQPNNIDVRAGPVVRKLKVTEAEN